jgi:hypothetical protein
MQEKLKAKKVKYNRNFNDMMISFGFP